MSGFPWYRSKPVDAASARAAADLPPSRRARASDPRRYVPTPDLVDAVNTALLLGQPLLLTGEPGTGKTLLASSVAWQLGLGEALRFDVKSTSKARDLFYTYDALGRFHAIQSGVGDRGVLPYLTYGPLGEAILRAGEPASVSALLPPHVTHRERRRSVVLIDEVDKAPRDFPNDILQELEDLSFSIPELGNASVSAPPDLRPVVVFTSNSEKALPDAFLRRCVYHDLRFPSRERLLEILAAQIDAKDEREPLLVRALDVFERLRRPETGLSKPPATAELIGWIAALRETSESERAATGSAPFVGIARRTLGALVKNGDDMANARRVLDDVGP